MRDEPTRPTAKTRAAERDDAHTTADADREPTPDEARRAEEFTSDPEVAEHEQEMAERGANQKGEGRSTSAARRAPARASSQSVRSARSSPVISKTLRTDCCAPTIRMRPSPSSRSRLYAPTSTPRPDESTKVTPPNCNVMSRAPRPMRFAELGPQPR